MNSALNIVTIHEAGHAIAALNFNQPVASISVVPKPSTVRGTSAKDDENRIIRVAGIIASSMLESGFQEKYDWNLVKNYGGDDDLAKARDEYDYSNGFLSVEDALERAWNLLYVNKAPLIRLANELKKKGQLSGDEVVKLTGDIKKCPLPNVLDDDEFDKMIKEMRDKSEK